MTELHAPDRVLRYLDEVVSRLAGSLVRDLVGVYVSGSLALADFDPDRSDVDLAVVMADGVPRSVRADVLQRVRHRVLPCPARGLELVGYPLESVTLPTPGPGFVLELNDGPGMPYQAHLDPHDRDRRVGDFWYLIDRAIVRSCGVALLGPPPQQLFAVQPDEWVHQALRASVRWHEEAPNRNAVLNACRALHWLHHRTWASKSTAGHWYLRKNGDDAAVRAALAGTDLPPRAAVRLLQTTAERLADSAI